MKKISIFLFSVFCFISLVAQPSKEQQLDSLADDVSQDIGNALSQLGAKQDSMYLSFLDSCTGTHYIYRESFLSADFADGNNATIMKRNVGEKVEYLLTTTEGEDFKFIDINSETYILLLLEELQKIMPEFTIIEILREKGAKFEGAEITYKSKTYEFFVSKTKSTFKVKLIQGGVSIELLKTGGKYYYEDKGKMLEVVSGRCGYNAALGELSVFLSQH